MLGFDNQWVQNAMKGREMNLAIALLTKATKTEKFDNLKVITKL